ncbi:MgtC/SapB family protein [Chondromyces apiculatus]|uniref:MgtC/SapB family protein n=1 Tax=Chondromyces apiculatus TaxID=51 RepID=UPI0005C45D47|nr:MgtC/SapB family protein [Chondromyces apiculatus]
MDGPGQSVVEVLRSEFSDMPDAGQLTRICVRLTMAVALAGVVGFEREAHRSPAGLRTHMLVALGAALFVLTPQMAGMESEDIGRVMQGVIAGIGFLGAGAILKMDDKGKVLGLTTAASIWATAAIGITAGMGRELTAIVSTVLTVFVLSGVRQIEKRYLGKKKGREHDGHDGEDPPREA